MTSGTPPPAMQPSFSFINVIFVGGSVVRLLPLLPTWFMYTDHRFRLVANGCDEVEQRLLADACERYPGRAEFHDLGVPETLEHGDALECLLELERGSHFAVLDSDVLLTRPTSLEAMLPGPNESACCSGLPRFHRNGDETCPPGFVVLAGRFSRTSSGFVVGSSYAAAYHTEQLRAVVREWDIGLRRTSWTELPQLVRDHLAAEDLVFRSYDTLKVANILLQRAGRLVRHVEIDGLVHLGAQSSPTITATRGRRLRWMTTRWIGQSIPGMSQWRRRRHGVGPREMSESDEYFRRQRAAVRAFDDVLREVRRRGTTDDADVQAALAARFGPPDADRPEHDRGLSRSH